MSALPQTVQRIDLLSWVAANNANPFDPNMVVSLSSNHTTDWEWQTVVAQMEDLKAQGYIVLLKRDAAGSTYWVMTPKGERYLSALNSFEKQQEIERLYPPDATGPTAKGDAPMTIVGGWEQLGPIGEGGQSRVYLVRHPERVQKRQNSVQELLRSNPWAPYAGGNEKELVERIDRLSVSLREYGRPDNPSELGALKMFKISDDQPEKTEALQRLSNEVTVLKQDRTGLVKLLAENEQEKWIVTEYMPDGTLFGAPTAYKGNAFGALRAFRSLVETVAGLHKDKYIHRDIKPANVFMMGYHELVLGDFGIVFLPEQAERVTLTNERVGPRDYMPQWADLGDRLENVHTNFDVYMLGKLLWCMVTGRLKLPREYHNRPAYDIRVIFPNDAAMPVLHGIIEKCVVEEPDHCLPSAVELLPLVDEQLAVLERGGQSMANGVPIYCRTCGKGRYQKVQLEPNVTGEPVVNLTIAGKPIAVSMFVCDKCYHAQFFRAG